MKKIIIPIPLILFALISCNIVVNKSQNIGENSDLSNVESNYDISLNEEIISPENSESQSTSIPSPITVPENL